MKSIERLVSRVIFFCGLLLFAPQIVALVTHLVRDVVTQPAPSTRTGTASGSGGFEVGPLTGLVVLVLLAGLMARIATLFRNRDPYRKALDRRARSLPRFPAERPESPAHSSEVDDPDDPAFG